MTPQGNTIKSSIDIYTANPFFFASHGAEIKAENVTLGFFDRENSGDLILREKSGIEILRASGWVEFLSACNHHAATKFFSSHE